MTSTGTVPKVSVVIPTYNMSLFVGHAINCVLQQTYQDFEIIVVDDGSTDETRAVVSQFLFDKRVRYVHQENRGNAAARNTGISASVGHFIALLDADDIWLSQKLERQLQALDSHPDCALLGTACYVVDTNDKVKFIMRHPCEDMHIRWAILFDSPFVQSSVVFPRALFEEIGPYNTEAGYHAEDYDLWSRFLSQYRAANLEEPLLLYRRNPQGISHTKWLSQEAQSVAVSARNMTQLLEDSSFTFERARQVRYLRGNWPDHWRKDDIEGAIDDLSLIHSRFLAKHKDDLESHPSVARAIKNDANQKLLMASIGLATCGARSSGLRMLRHALRAEVGLCLRLTFWGTIALLALGPRISGRLVGTARRWRFRQLGLASKSGSESRS